MGARRLPDFMDKQGAESEHKEGGNGSAPIPVKEAGDQKEADDENDGLDPDFPPERFHAPQSSTGVNTCARIREGRVQNETEGTRTKAKAPRKTWRAVRPNKRRKKRKTATLSLWQGWRSPLLRWPVSSSVLACPNASIDRRRARHVSASLWSAGIRSRRAPPGNKEPG